MDIPIKAADASLITNGTPLNENRKIRFFFLSLACFLAFGCYFAYDNPAALETQLKSDLHLSSLQYSLLYSIYSFPNIFFPLIGAWLIERLGVRSLLYISSTFVTLGQGLFALGVTANSYPLALLGRAIFGCGGDNLDMAQGYLVIDWFSDHELSTAIGITGTISYIGSILNYICEPIVESNLNIQAAFWLGFLVCLASFTVILCVGALDKKREKSINRKRKSELPDSDRVNFKDIKEMDSKVWLLLVYATLYDSSFVCFIFISTGFYQSRFHYSEVESAFIITIPYIISAIFGPVIGMISDKLGRRVALIILSALLLFGFHLALLLTPDSNKPMLSLVYIAVLGLSYAISCSVYWSVLSSSVEEKVLGTALGLNYSISNLGIATVPIIVGLIQDASHKEDGYFWCSVIFASMAFISLMAGVVLYAIDTKSGGVLSSRQAYSMVTIEEGDHLEEEDHLNR